jgi:glutaminyl-peptide cyclotransferase
MKKVMNIFICIFLIHIYAFGQDSLSPMMHINKLAQFKERVPGTPGHKKTVDYITSYFKKQKLLFKKDSFLARTPLGVKQISNIVATFPSLKDPKQTVVLATHFDSKYFKDFFFLGADDGLSGVGLLLSLAKELKKNSFQRTRVLLLFLDGEEAFQTWSRSDSLYGSHNQALLWQKNGFLKQIDAFILFDMVGGKKLHFCKEALSDPKLTKEFFEEGQKLQKENIFDFNCQSAVEDDHIPFALKGVPVLELIPIPFPFYWHTKEDTLDKISEASLLLMKETTLSYLKRKDSQND